MANGRHQLIFKNGKYEIPLPLLDEHNHAKGGLAHLSDWDSFTMRFSSPKEMMDTYRRLNYIKGHEGEFYLCTKPSKNQRKPLPLEVAYEDDYLLAHALIRGENNIRKTDPFVNRFLNNFIKDLEHSNGRIVTEILHPIQKDSERTTYIDSFIRERIQDFLYNFAPLPAPDGYSEQREILEDREYLGERLKKHLSDNYKRFRGVYFFYRDYEEKYPFHSISFNQLQDDLRSEHTLSLAPYELLKQLPIEEDPDHNPYFIMDEFDRPEAPVPEELVSHAYQKQLPRPKRRKPNNPQQLSMEDYLAKRDNLE